RLDAGRLSVVAVMEPESCFVGTLLEVAFAARKISMFDGATVVLTGMNLGPLPRADGRTRLESRFPGRGDHLAALARRVGDPIPAAEAADLGLLGAQGASGASR